MPARKKPGCALWPSGVFRITEDASFVLAETLAVEGLEGERLFYLIGRDDAELEQELAEERAVSANRGAVAAIGTGQTFIHLRKG